MFFPHMGGFSWVGWIVGFIIMLLFLGALVTLVYFLIRAISVNQSGDSQLGRGGDALEILKQRYVRGEISKAEYEEMRSDLAT